jgi:hypothetical protein
MSTVGKKSKCEKCCKKDPNRPEKSNGCSPGGNWKSLLRRSLHRALKNEYNFKKAEMGTKPIQTEGTTGE